VRQHELALAMPVMPLVLGRQLHSSSDCIVVITAVNTNLQQHYKSMKAAQRHNPTQAHSKQSSQHDTIETALTVRMPSARRYSSSRVCGSRRAANHKQARFQTRSITKSLEQRHMHS
jgi:hypothetical protein